LNSSLSENPARANGELRVEEGFYKAYGQALDVERGRLVFGGGPLDNPAIDARAVRYLESIIVGVNVRGTLRDPKLSVFSDPPRSQQYALKLLLLGDLPVELGRASDSLSYGRPSEELDRSVGLGGAGGAPTTLGNYLSPDTYMGYLESLSMRYRLSRKWTVEASRGIETSVGIFYSLYSKR
jgi:translocation and assembly module TamB